jgi:hypothetical protein
VKAYLDGTLQELEARREHLLAGVARRPEPELRLLLDTTLKHLEALGPKIAALRSEPRYRQDGAEAAVLRQLRRIVGDLDHLEAFPVAALRRWEDADARLTRLVSGIIREIAFPRPAPVAACLSQDYYAVWPESHLIVAPLTESRFLLHVADLYHELAHLLFHAKGDTRLAPFLRAYRSASAMGLAYCLEERRREEDSSLPPHSMRDRFGLWARCFSSWIEELACDLFAVFTCGPAFAWAHIHLWTKRGSDPFRLPAVEMRWHPCDAVRLSSMNEALISLGFDDDAKGIGAHWRRVTAAAHLQETPAYRRCFPSDLVRGIASTLLDGVAGLGVRRVEPGHMGPIADRLNDAWHRFLQEPDRYAAWEARAAEELMADTSFQAGRASGR